MIKHIIKTIKDTVTNPKDGKVSRKSLTMMVSMVNLCALTWCEMFSNMPILADNYSMRINDSVLWLFGSLVAGLAGITVWDKGKKSSVPEGGFEEPPPGRFD
jgi:hypothetical protein